MPPPQSGQVHAPSAQVVHDLLTRQMIRQRLALRPSRGLAAGRSSAIGLRRSSSASPVSSSSSRNSSCSIWRADPFRRAAKLHPSQLGDLELELLDLQRCASCTDSSARLQFGSGRPAQTRAMRPDRRAGRPWRATWPSSNEAAEFGRTQAATNRCICHTSIGRAGDGRCYRSAPIHCLDQQRQLRRRQCHRAIDNRRPDEAALLQAAWQTGTDRCRPSTAPSSNHHACRGT